VSKTTLFLLIIVLGILSIALLDKLNLEDITVTIINICKTVGATKWQLLVDSFMVSIIS